MTSQMREGTIHKCDMASIYTYQNTLYKLQMNGDVYKRQRLVWQRTTTLPSVKVMRRGFFKRSVIILSLIHI